MPREFDPGDVDFVVANGLADDEPGIVLGADDAGRPGTLKDWDRWAAPAVPASTATVDRRQ